MWPRPKLTHSPVDDGDEVKRPEDDPGAEAEDGAAGERYVQRGPGPHGHRREQLRCHEKRELFWPESSSWNWKWGSSSHCSFTKTDAEIAVNSIYRVSISSETSVLCT